MSNLKAEAHSPLTVTPAINCRYVHDKLAEEHSFKNFFQVNRKQKKMKTNIHFYLWTLAWNKCCKKFSIQHVVLLPSVTAGMNLMNFADYVRDCSTRMFQWSNIIQTLGKTIRQAKNTHIKKNRNYFTSNYKKYEWKIRSTQKMFHFSTQQQW